MILTIRTDKPEAEVGLFTAEGTEIRYYKWQADRQLAKTLHSVINDELHAANASWDDIEGVIVFEGPGSFTGLRIGITVANALAYSLGIPIVGTQKEEWVHEGLQKIGNTNQKIVLPYYGGEAHITKPRK